MSTLQTHLLADLIGRKHECLNQLLELGRQQFALVDQGEITQLLKVLAAKQQLLGRLQQIEHELDPFRDQRPEDRQWASPAAREKCAELIQRTQTLFGQIMVQEKQSEQRLIQRRDEAATRLQGAHSASFARGAYAAVPQQQGSYLDLSTEN